MSRSTSRLRFLGICVLGTLAGSQVVEAATLRVRAYVDGRSRLILQGNQVYWHHLDFAAPGRQLFVDEPTYLDDEAWLPTWPDIPNRENRGCNCESSRHDLAPPLPRRPQEIGLEIVRARSRVAIVEQPSEANGFRAVVEFDDNGPANSDWYEVVLTYQATQHDSWLGWEMDFEVSEDDGLVLSDVRLGPRRLAETMGLPYLVLTTDLVSGARLELLARDLVRLTTAHEPDRLVIEAAYRLTGLPSGTASQLSVTQRYEFFREIDEALEPSLACEPSPRLTLVSPNFPFPDLTCARFRPIVNYDFVGVGEQIVSLNSVQRLHFTPDGLPLQAGALIHDCDASSGTVTEPCLRAGLEVVPVVIFIGPIPVRIELHYALGIASCAGSSCSPANVFAAPFAPGVQLKNNQNPLLEELMQEVIRAGQPAGWDNFHLTTNPSVQLPVPIPPGCPECVHIHWRWAAFFGTQFGDGQPMIHNNAATDPFSRPTSTNPDSQQDVTVALTAANPGEEDPLDFTTLVGPPEPLPSPLGTVLWYSAASQLQNGNPPVHDEFFNHGGFFSSQPAGSVDVSATQSASGDFGLPARARRPINWDVVVRNDSPNDAREVLVVLQLPGLLQPLAAPISPQGPCQVARFGAGLYASCRLDVPAHDTATVRFRVQPPFPGQVTGHVLVNPAAYDFDRSNNRSVETVVIQP